MSVLTIRRATESDAKGIQHCLQSAFAPYESQFTPAGFIDAAPTVQEIRGRFASMSLFVAVVESGAIVGTIAWHPNSPEEGHIRGMAVLTEWQGKGVAQQLMSAAESEIRAHGCRRASLDTNDPLERAIRFYEKQGYRCTGKTIDSFQMSLIAFVKELK
jgi:GNAT superfamily N-acetyltransferase